MDLDDFHLRPLEPGDQPAVWRLHNQALEGTGAHAGNGPWDEDLLDPVASYLDRGGEFLVGVLGAELVAMGALAPPDGSSAELKRMRVHPAHQGRGFGTRVLHALERRARERGLRRLYLETTEQQLAARGLYQRNGYRELRRGTLGRFRIVCYQKELW